MSKKNDKKAKGGPDEIPAYKVEIKLEVNEVGNMGNDAGRFVLDASFMEKSLEREKLLIFKPCHCGPIDFYYFSWTLPLQIKDEGDLINISSNPIVVTCYKLNLDEEKGDPEEITNDMLTIKSLAIIDLTDIITTQVENVLKTIPFQYPKIKKGASVRTWPNMPFIKCCLSTSKPIIYDPEINYSKFSITVECLINLPEIILNNIETCEAGLVLRLPSGNEKILKCSNGFVTKKNNLPQKKVIWNLSHLEHCAKYSENPTNCSFTEDNIIIPNTNIILENPLLSDDSKVVAFYCEHQSIISHKSLLFMAGSSNCLSIEIFIKTKDNSQDKEKDNTKKLTVVEESRHFVGFFSVMLLRTVEKTHIRSLIPLSVFNLAEIEKQCGNTISVFYTAPAPAPAPKTQMGKGKEINKRQDHGKKVKEPVVAEVKYEKSRYISNDEGNTTCVTIEINIDPPIVPRRFEKFTIEDIQRIETTTIHETASKHSMKELSFIFKREVEEYTSGLAECRKTHLCRQPPEGNLFGAATALLLKKFNFSEANNEERAQNILENSYIYLMNEIYNIIMKGSFCENATSKRSAFKLHCASECLITGMNKEAEDFFIMNIRDEKRADEYVHYAIYGLHFGNIDLCLACCEDALKLSSKFYICYLLQAYVAFVQKDYKTAERILKCGTLKNDMFVEFWLGLFVIHYQAEDRNQMCVDLRNIVLAAKAPYECELNIHNYILTWKPQRYTDPILNGVVNFIQWKLIEFAEVLLAWIVHEYGQQSFVFQYNMALIEYYRKDYIAVLQRLGNIKNCTKLEHFDKICLKAHTLMNLDSIQAINQIRQLITYMDNCDINKRTSLIFLKLGKLYIKSKKYKTASFYLKQCAYAQATFASYILLGESELQLCHLDNAEACFKLSYQLNPFNSFSWGNLAVIYYRKGLIPHYKLAAKNAREGECLDKNLANELKRIEEILGPDVLEQNNI